jgi:hypothetical protein
MVEDHGQRLNQRHTVWFRWLHRGEPARPRAKAGAVPIRRRVTAPNPTERR